MRRSVALVVVPALFASVLVVLFLISKNKAAPQKAGDATPANAGRVGGSLEAGRAEGHDGVVPSTDGWDEITVRSAKVRLRIPRGASVPGERAGHSTSAGSYFRVVMPSGYDVYFAERRGSAAVDIAAQKLAYRSKPKETVSFLLEAEDAVIVKRSDPPPTGSYWEVTACGTLGSKPMCVVYEGGRLEGTELKKLTEEECFEVVAMARTIRER